MRFTKGNSPLNESNENDTETTSAGGSWHSENDNAPVSKRMGIIVLSAEQNVRLFVPEDGVVAYTGFFYLTVQLCPQSCMTLLVFFLKSRLEEHLE